MVKGMLFNKLTVVLLILFSILKSEYVLSSTLRDVVISDITSFGFTILASGLGENEAIIEVYDQDNNQIPDVAVEYAFVSGSRQELSNNFQQSRYQVTLAEKTWAKSLLRGRVSGLLSDKAYYVRIKLISSGAESYYPESQYLEVITRSSSGFVNDAFSYVIDIPQEIATDGAILYANIIGQSDYISSVVGDGGQSGRVFISLANLNSFRSDISMDQVPWGAIEFTILEEEQTAHHNFGSYAIDQGFSVSSVQGAVVNDGAIATPPVIHLGTNLVSFNQFVESRYRLILSDVNGDTPLLALDGAPSGMIIEKIWGGSGSSIYEIVWMPQAGQLGRHNFSVIGSDGLLSRETFLEAFVYPQDDTDSDGMDDGWEVQYFGSLDEGGSQDFDGDGYSNETEFYSGWDPTLESSLPKALMEIQPIYGSKISTREAFLTVVNAEHSEDISVKYEFEVYDSEYLVQLTRQSVLEQSESTSIQLPENLVEDQVYYWRVRAIHKDLATRWVYGKVQLDQNAEAPSAPEVRYPYDESYVSTSRPMLSVYEAKDSDSDALEYQFYVFDQLTEIGSNIEPVAKVTSLTIPDDGYISWRIPTELVAGVEYYWYAVVKDSMGNASYTNINKFSIDTTKVAIPSVQLTYPIDAISVDGNAVSFQWNRPEELLSLSPRYQFEISTTDQFETMLFQTEIESLGALESISWEGPFNENQKYFWRLKAVLSEGEGPWQKSSFVYNNVNNVPSIPFIIYPGHNEVVYADHFRMGVRIPTDDSDLLTYEYEIFQETDLKNPIVVDESSKQDWQSSSLNAGRYLWRVRSLDSGGLRSEWSGLSKVTLSPNKSENIQKFKFVSLPEGGELAGDLLNIQWVDYDLSEGSLLHLYYISPMGDEVLLSNNIDVFSDHESDLLTWNISGLETGAYKFKAVLTNNLSSHTVLSDSDVILQASSAQPISFKLMSPNLVDEFGEKVVEIQAFATQPITAPFDIPLSVSGTEIKIDNVILEGIVSAGHTLHFTTDNWQEPYIIRIKGLDDCVIDGNQSGYFIIHESIPLNQDVESFNVPDIEIVNEDNEVQGQQLFVCNYTVETVSENLYEVTANLENRGEDQFDVVGSISATGDSFVISSDSSVLFPNVKFGQQVSNAIPIQVLINSGSFESSKLSWSFTSRSANSDLSILLDNSDSKWKNGKFVAKSISSNLGTQPAEQVEIKITVPDELNKFSFSDSSCLYQQPYIICNKDVLQVDDNWIVNITATTDDSKTEFEFTGRINAQNNDPNMNNNTSVEKFGGAFNLWWLLVFLSVSSLVRLRKLH